MKLLLIASTPESIIPFRGKLISALSIKGIEVHVCAPFSEKHTIIIQQLRENYGAEVHSIQLKRARANVFSDLIFFLGILGVIRSVRPDMLFSYTMKPVIFGSIAGWVMRVPLRYSMITGLGFLFIDSQSGLKRIVQMLGKKLLKFSVQLNKKVFFQNNDDLVLFRSRKITSVKQQTAVINGSGVDLRYYDLRPMPSEASFLLISRMIKNKGIIEFIDAIRDVKKVYPFVNFTMVGGLEKNIDALSVDEIQLWVSEGLVDYKGPLDDVRVEIEKCSIYVLPSYREGTPRSVLEAMSMGRAIITTDVPGCRETVIDNVTGLLVHPKNSEDLADAMKRLIEDKELREKMGQKSREYATQRYCDNKVADDIIKQLAL